jgi:FkbH-like protein
MSAPELLWLPESEDWRERYSHFAKDPSATIAEGIALAGYRLDFVRVNALDKLIQERWNRIPYEFCGQSIRVALLGSSTLKHLIPSIRIAALRRSMWVEVYEGEYGTYLQELLDPSSRLFSFRPNAIVFAFDGPHLTQGVRVTDTAVEVDRRLDEFGAHISRCWELAQTAFGCSILQQTVLPSFAQLIGENEHLLPGSRAAFVGRANARLRELASAHRVDLVSVDTHAVRDGIMAWRDPALWYRSKQEITPAAAPMYGELVARVLGARAGKSYKALVLDLDNTLWGGVIGDDGLDGIILGKGNALGEGYLAVQEFVQQLSKCGIILAVCSKNDEATALEAFDKLPDMLLRRDDIACFRINWRDKVSNIRDIADALQIGVDSIVLLDDNPFERNFVRQQLPTVAVPEVPNDPALIPDLLAAAGYFENASFTKEDRERSELYQRNARREQLRAQNPDIKTFLNSLKMRLISRRFDRVNESRIAQLINKTNQFNLTSRRYTLEEVGACIGNPNVLALHFRLIDCFGDNGLIAVVVGRREEPLAIRIESWLMSCRVLGRGVEDAVLAAVAVEALRMGAQQLIGEYIPTDRNGIVRNHYTSMGFEELQGGTRDSKRYRLELTEYRAPELNMTLEYGDSDGPS